MIRRHQKEIISGISAGFGGGVGIIVSDLASLGLIPTIILAIVFGIVFSVILHVFIR